MKSKHKSQRVALASKLLILLCFALALSAGTGLLAALVPEATAQRRNSGIGEKALRQIQSLVAEKRRQSGKQRKIDSQLWFASKMRRGEAITAEIVRLDVNVELGDGGRTTVDISARVTPRLLGRLDEMGAQVVRAVPEYNSVRASILLEQLDEIATLPEVFFIQPKQQAITNRAMAADLVSEGDVAHGAAEARNTFGFNGTGVKIGVLSNGAANLHVSQAKGALGPVTVLPGQIGAGDEGTAMLEIVHAIAPGAQLYFATAFDGIASFAQNIRKLRRLGCDVIVDDVFYFAESVFQDGQPAGVSSTTDGGLITQAVNEVTAAGAMYFASAGNAGSLIKGTSGVWEGDFKDGGATPSPLPLEAGRIHDFGGGNLTNQITTSTSNPVILEWSDPLGGSNNDYDLYLLNAAGTSLLAASLNPQDGTQDPFEGVSGQSAGQRLVIVKFSGEDRFLHLNTTRGTLAIATNGQTHGHNAAAGAFSVAATPAYLPFGAAPNPTGPFPGVFTAASKIELFSSDGPRRLFFSPESTAYTPGDLLSTGGVLRQKPDITAADGTSVTGVGLFPVPFFGSSSAAPHAAAIAALLKSANPSFTSAQIRNALLSSAIDIEAKGIDSISGAGIVMPIDGARVLGVTPMADLELGAISVREVGGNGNGVLEPGESAQLNIELKNRGVVSASAVTATLSSSTPGIFTGSPDTANYGDIAAGAGAELFSTSYNFTLSSISACNLRAFFSLALNYGGGPSPKTLSFELPTGPAPTTIVSTLDAAAPASGANFMATTGLQAGRMVRTFAPSACGLDKSFPGISSPLVRRFDAYTFATCPTSASTCLTVTLSSSCGVNTLFAAAYLDGFNPNEIAANYLGDSGDGPSPGREVSFSFSLPPSRSFVIVVHELNPGGAAGCDYQVSVSGLCDSCATANLVCLQDDTNDDSLLFNLLSGDYLFTRCADGSTLAGRGEIGRAPGLITLIDGPRVNAAQERFSGRGSARIRLNSIGRVFTINDRNIYNNTCPCR